MTTGEMMRKIERSRVEAVVIMILSLASCVLVLLTVRESRGVAMWLVIGFVAIGRVGSRFLGMAAVLRELATRIPDAGDSGRGTG